MNHSSHLDTLINSTCNRIHTYEIARVRKMTLLHSILGVFAAIALVPAVMYLFQGVAQSGLIEYIQLIFSDGTSVAVLWKEFFVSIAESIPIIETTACVALVLIFTNALQKTKSLTGTFVPRHFAHLLINTQ